MPSSFRVQLVGCCWSHPTTSCLTLTGWTPWFRPTAARSTASCVPWRRCSLPPSTKRSLIPRSERPCQSKANQAHAEILTFVRCCILQGSAALQDHSRSSHYVVFSMPGSPITLFLPLSPWQRCSGLALINVTCCCTRVRSHQQPADRFFASRAPKQKKTAITPGLMKYAFPLLHSHCSTVYTVGSSHLFVFPPTDLSELFYFFHLDCFQLV